MGTKIIDLAYGKEGLRVELPDHNLTIIEPRYIPGLVSEREALIKALRNPVGSPPLRELASPGKKAVVVFCDITRPMPNDRVLPVVLEELEAGGIKTEDITLINATGTHRAQTGPELEKMLGVQIVRKYRVINHSAHDKTLLTFMGKTSFGAEVWLSTEYLKADLKVLTGFIEPHFFAGFSGGPKMVLPGVAGIDTVLHAHGAKMIGSPKATWGITYGNPIQDEIREGAAMGGSDFSINVTLNKDHAITNVFAGEVFESHKPGCEFVRQTAMQAVPELFDIVITTNSGYPLDQNLYQAVKGMSAAALVVKEGGAIIAAAECADGLPDHGNFKAIFKLAAHPRGLLELINSPGFEMFDQWQTQILAQILLKARVFIKTSYLSPGQVREAMLHPIEDIAATVEQLRAEYGPEAKICVLPQGPQTVPYLAIETPQPALV